MSEKDTLLKKLGVLAKTLNREPPVDGTVAELKVLLTEWQAEADALEDDGSGDETTLDMQGGGANSDGPAGSNTDDNVPTAAKVSAGQLVRFTALATLHINAVNDANEVLPVVVAGGCARIPDALFSQLQRRNLVKKV
ncbi:DNA-packaging protein FI [Buttiauxella sp. A111]|uniref:DNA-packaging protein FI n=1 Tax=Buttiauxella sp. A111 TaxID=2563088 RepID=UPI0010D62E9C|nr:DNA-packaging protein FI [Buttiauxella sp. A111]GDX06644.1 DNA-packaging protein [Buttiauxella sp. A111]